MAEEIISSPRSWKPPPMEDSQELLLTKTFRGDRPTAVSCEPVSILDARYILVYFQP
jgi:hypothetical protein